MCELNKKGRSLAVQHACLQVRKLYLRKCCPGGSSNHIVITKSEPSLPIDLHDIQHCAAASSPRGGQGGAATCKEAEGAVSPPPNINFAILKWKVAPGSSHTKA